MEFKNFNAIDDENHEELLGSLKFKGGRFFLKRPGIVNLPLLRLQKNFVKICINTL
jgi:hypothetical protein